MRSLILMASVVVLAACSTREKECKEALPLVEAANAEPNDETLARLKAFKARDAELDGAVASYAKALERLLVSQRAFAQLVASFKMKSDAGTSFKMEMFDASRPHADRLYGRCLPADAPPDCAELARALEACAAPERDDTSAEEALLSCANRFGAVRSTDKATNESIQAVAKAMRDLEPFARNVGAPAKEIIKTAKELAPKVGDSQRARASAMRAAMDVRNVCQSAPR